MSDLISEISSAKNRKVGLPCITVVICTRNRKKELENCLTSIFEMDYRRSNFEVIVVDNGSTDGTYEMVKKEFPEAKLVVENRKGLSYARNTGAKVAKGHIIAYTDDDCIVDKNWLKRLAYGFSVANVIGVGGPVYLFEPELIPKKIFVKEALGVFEEGERIRFIPAIPGGNCAFKREAFETAKFDTTLGKQGQTLFGGDEVDFCWTLRDSGYKFLYIPDAIVYHKIDAQRATLRYILKRAYYNGISTELLLKKRKSRIRVIVSLIRNILVRLVTFWISNEKSYVTSQLVKELTALFNCLTFFDRRRIP